MSGVVYYRWLNNPSFPVGGREARERLYGRRCRVVARGSKGSVLLEFIDGREPHRTVTSRYAVSKDPPRPLEPRLTRSDAGCRDVSQR